MHDELLCSVQTDISYLAHCFFAYILTLVPIHFSLFFNKALSFTITCKMLFSLCIFFFAQI